MTVMHRRWMKYTATGFYWSAKSLPSIWNEPNICASLSQHFWGCCLMHDPHQSAPVWPSSALNTLVKPPSSPDGLVSVLEWCESHAGWWLNRTDFPCSYSISILPLNWTDSAVVMVTLGHRFGRGATDGRDLPVDLISAVMPQLGFICPFNINAFVPFGLTVCQLLVLDDGWCLEL